MLCEHARRDGTRLAGRIVEALEAPFGAGERLVAARVSVGVAVRNGHARPAGILGEAAAAARRGRARGGGRYEVFDAAFRERSVEEARAERAIRDALEHGEMTLLYQPLVELGTGVVGGVEALVRWRRRGHGLLLPLEFLPVAEETGAIVPLGEWVMTEALRQRARWQAEDRSREAPLVTVNLSCRQVADPHLGSRITRLLAEADAPPRTLALEVTEATLIDEREEVGANLARLADLGVRLFVDDFGTGPTALRALDRTPLDGLKIDRSVVEDVDSDGGERAIVEAVVGLARSRDIATIAEGVERPSQLAALEAIGCDLAQGYHLAPPSPAGAIAELLRGAAA